MTTKENTLLALPYVHSKQGKPYVRLNYLDERAGRWKSKEKRVKTVEDAIAAYEKLRQKIANAPADYDPDRMTFDQLIDEYKKAKQPPGWYLRPLEEYFGHRRIKTITYGDLAQFRREREAIVSPITHRLRKPATINRELEILRGVLLFAVRHGWLGRNPFIAGGDTLIRKSEEEPRCRIPSPDEEARILEWCLDFRSWIQQLGKARGLGGLELAKAIGADAVMRIKSGKRIKDRDIEIVGKVLGEDLETVREMARGKRTHLRPILIGLRDTGLRKGALMSLTWSMVDLENGFLSIPKGPRNKKRPPVIAMTVRLRTELSKLWERSDKKPESKIFGDTGDFRRAYATACRLAGVENLRIHDWRHGFATDLMEAGVPERVAMRAAGHTSSETHAIYTNVDERIAKMIADKLNELHASRQASAAASASQVAQATESSQWIN